jgi:hypothetical protein
MKKTNTIFDETWITRAQSCDDNLSWVKDVITKHETHRGKGHKKKP